MARPKKMTEAKRGPGRPKKTTTAAVNPLTVNPDKYAQIRYLVDEMLVVADINDDDFSGHKMAAKYGFMCRIVDEMNLLLRQIERQG